MFGIFLENEKTVKEIIGKVWGPNLKYKIHGIICKCVRIFIIDP